MRDKKKKKKKKVVTTIPIKKCLQHVLNSLGLLAHASKAIPRDATQPIKSVHLRRLTESRQTGRSEKRVRDGDRERGQK